MKAQGSKLPVFAQESYYYLRAEYYFQVKFRRYNAWTRPLFVGSYLQVKFWALGQWKGRKIALNDNSWSDKVVKMSDFNIHMTEFAIYQKPVLVHTACCNSVSLLSTFLISFIASNAKTVCSLEYKYFYCRVISLKLISRPWLT